MSVKTQRIGAIFVVLVIILAVNPKTVNNIYNTILGRLFLIAVVIFFAMHNTTLGLLTALTIITALNQFGSFTEGMTIGDDNMVSPGDEKVSVVVDKKKSELNDEGIDKESIKSVRILVFS